MYYVCNDEGVIGEFASFEDAEEFLIEHDNDGDMWISFLLSQKNKKSLDKLNKECYNKYRKKER